HDIVEPVRDAVRTRLDIELLCNARLDSPAERLEEPRGSPAARQYLAHRTAQKLFRTTAEQAAVRPVHVGPPEIHDVQVCIANRREDAEAHVGGVERNPEALLGLLARALRALRGRDVAIGLEHQLNSLRIAHELHARGDDDFAAIPASMAKLPSPPTRVAERLGDLGATGERPRGEQLDRARPERLARRIAVELFGSLVPELDRAAGSPHEDRIVRKPQ